MFCLIRCRCKSMVLGVCAGRSKVIVELLCDVAHLEQVASFK